MSLRAITNPDQAPPGWAVWRRLKTGELIAGIPNSRELHELRRQNGGVEAWEQVPRPTGRVPA